MTNRLATTLRQTLTRKFQYIEKCRITTYNFDGAKAPLNLHSESKTWVFFYKGTFKNDVSFGLLNKQNPPRPLDQLPSVFGLPPYPPASAVSFWLTPLPRLSAVSFGPTPPHYIKFTT